MVTGGIEPHINVVLLLQNLKIARSRIPLARQAMELRRTRRPRCQLVFYTHDLCVTSAKRLGGCQPNHRHDFSGRPFPIALCLGVKTSLLAKPLRFIR